MYAAGNPTDFTDPLGLKIVQCAGGGTGFMPEYEDPTTGKANRNSRGQLIGTCKILLFCADPPRRMSIYTTEISHTAPCPPCPGPADCLAFVDTDTGQAVGKVACSDKRKKSFRGRGATGGW